MAYNREDFFFNTPSPDPKYNRTLSISINKLNRRIEGNRFFWDEMAYAIKELFSIYSDRYEIPLVICFTEGGGSYCYWGQDMNGAYWIYVDLKSISKMFHNGFQEYRQVQPVLNEILPGWQEWRGFETLALLVCHEFAHAIEYRWARMRDLGFPGGHGDLFRTKYRTLLIDSKEAFECLKELDAEISA